MKKWMLFVLLFAFVETGCKDNLPEGDIPEWLSIRIRELEVIHSKDIAIVNVQIYKGKWNDRIIYFINNTLNSCMFCEVYYENGEQAVLLPGDYSFESMDKSDWVLIYEFGEGPIYDKCASAFIVEKRCGKIFIVCL
jgi:hypothetical protein